VRVAYYFLNGSFLFDEPDGRIYIQNRKEKTMTNNTVLYTDEAFFNFALSRYYRSEPDHFTFSKPLTDMNVEVVGALKQAPALDLSYTGDNENFLVTFPEIRITAYDFTNGRRGQALTEVSLHQLRFSGKLELNGGKFHLTSLEALPVEGELEQLVVSAVNWIIIPMYGNRLMLLPLPDVKQLIGIPVDLISLSVSHRVVQVQARLGISGDSIAPAMPLPGIQKPFVLAAISEGGLNDLIQSRPEFPLTKTLSDSGGNWFGAWRVRATVTILNPAISIVNGNASGTADVHVDASVVIKALGRWEDVPISVSFRSPKIGLHLYPDASGKKAMLSFGLTEPVSLTFLLPDELQTLPAPILSALSPLSGYITEEINHALEAATTLLFTLPGTIPGLEIAAHFKFASLGFANNAVAASVVAE
jgi:hypothetical protein